MAVTPNTTFTSGQILTAQAANNWPRGIMGYAISTANTAVTTTEADITGMTATFTGVANRLYRATFSCFYQKSTTGRVFITMTDGSNVSQNLTMQQTASGEFDSITAIFLFSVTGSTTRKFRASTEFGTATIFGAPADGRTYSMTIEDIGGI